jgi:hypothetical protein
MSNHIINIKIHLQSIFIFLRNTLYAVPYIFSKNNLKFFPRYPSFWLPVCIKLNRDQIYGYSSITNKAGRDMNIVCEIDKNKFITIKQLFQENPKYITAHQVLNKSEKNIFNLSEFSFYKKILNSGKITRGMKSSSDIESYLKERIKFFNQFKTYGYKQQYKNYSDYNSEMQFLYLGSGKFIKVNSGNHRFAAIEVLKIKKFNGHVIAIDKDYLLQFGKERGFKVLNRLRQEFKQHKNIMIEKFN